MLSSLGTHESTTLSTRLSAWHDAMVAHERQLRAGPTDDTCDDECPHAEARVLWLEAVSAFGARAQELVFLRSRAGDVRRRVTTAESRDALSDAADRGRARARDPRVGTTASPASSATAATES
jgi:hypothetical protein